jgi:spermidine/putrescine transport system substrate-binding protein
MLKMFMTINYVMYVARLIKAKLIAALVLLMLTITSAAMAAAAVDNGVVAQQSLSAAPINASMSAPASAQAQHRQENSLNLYAWSNYVPNKVLRQFTKETGIKINLSEYDSNETMFVKLKASKQAGYDVVIPSNYFVARMIKQGMLYPLNKDLLPNLKNINPALLGRGYDPQNRYSVPYLWGASGIVVNSKYIDPNKVRSWKDFWQPQYKDQLMMLSDLRDIFGMALMVLGYSADDKDPEHVRLAYLKLKELLPNVKLFNSDAEQTIYIDEDAVIGMGWNGDIRLTRQENPDVKFIYPEEGSIVWIDSLVIAKNAPHPENAHKFINFLMRPDIAKTISTSVGYASSNLEAVKLLPEEMRRDTTINPSQEVLARTQMQNDLDAVMPIYEKYWEMLRIGE